MHGRFSTGRDAGIRFLAAAGVIAALVAGCAGGPRPRAGYDRRVDPLDAVDAAPLAGKRIVLDPGHGGHFRGALGVKGLTEAEVNLGVANQLAQMLRAKGAEVLLTREIDRDFLTPADSSLRSDLNERSRLANAFAPDLFVSIHHNADAGGSHRVNETQVYYELGDDGPSLDAAADVERFLGRNLGIQKSRVLPGNYSVLRNSMSPALLTESSYITYPPTEKRLVHDDARTIEAEALYLGIAAYFGRKAPEILSITTHTDSITRLARPRISAEVVGPFDVVDMRMDGVRVEPLKFGEVISWQPPLPLEAGPHEASLLVRLAGEGASRRRWVRFVVDPDPDSVAIETWTRTRVRNSMSEPVRFDSLGPPLQAEFVAMRVRALSREGALLRDSLEVRLQSPKGWLPPDTVVTISDGAAWGYFRNSQLPEKPSPVEFGASLLKKDARVFRATAARPVPLSDLFAIEMPANVTLRNVPGTKEPNRSYSPMNRDGFLFQNLNVGSGVPGYRGWFIPDPIRYRRDEPPPDSVQVPRFVAIANGALHYRRIVIDAAGGGDDDAGRSPAGGRAATVNLETARALAAMLDAAGAEVKLTREDGGALSDLERVKIAEAFHADRFVRIGHAAEPPRVGHYFSSAAGKRWGARLADIAADLGLPRPTVGDDAQYPIQQTSSTALYASLGRIDDPAVALGNYPSERLRREAYAMYLALAREWQPEAGWPLDTLELVSANGTPLPGRPVRLGGALVLETDALGRVRFVRTEPGPMLVEVLDDRAPFQRVLLDSDRAVRLTGPKP